MSDLDTTPSKEPRSGLILEEESLGLAGKTARFFINSPLSPLLYLTLFLLGVGGLIITPRQEDPQISVPMVDLFVQYPGASAQEVASLAIQPLERIMSEIKGVEHVYSAIERGQGVVTVQFIVGEEMEPSLVKVNDQLDSNMDLIPPGVLPPLVKAKGIDDVPAVTITLWSEKDYNGDGVPDIDDSQLRRLALSVLQSLKEIPETGEGFVVGGRSEQLTIDVMPERLAGFGISLEQVAQAVKGANSEFRVGDVETGGSQMTVVTGAFLRTVDDVSQLQVGNHNGVPVYVYDVAKVRQGPEDAKQMVAYYTGAASEEPDRAVSVPAVTIALAKQKGANIVDVADRILERVESLKGRMIPPDIEVSITRNYGVSANQKVNSLIFKLFVATGFVFLLVWGAFRALKPAIVVLLVIPVVLLFTIFAAWLLGFTIDRVSLFALIFSIGILVDDAIVVVENIYRRWLEQGSTDAASAVDAVREVGNPTILATFTVIAALLPMGFVSGMMGPYMMPIPALGSTAMFISLFAAFVFTPWLAIHKWFKPTMKYLETAEAREHKESQQLDKFYRRILIPMIERPANARLFRLALWGSFLLACSLFYIEWVPVKMLPLDNKSEFSVVLDMPEGSALAETANTANKIANLVRIMPEVSAVQMYVGTAKPFDFNGMVRHYYVRNRPWQAEVQIQLVDKGDRARSSHDIAVDARQKVTELLKGTQARFAVVEMPPGPPVLQSVVAEVHGPDAEIRRQVAADLTDIFRQTDSLRDVDNYMRMKYDYWHFMVDREKADRRGITVQQINQNLNMALGGMVLGDVKQRAGHEPVNILLQMPIEERSQISRLTDILIQSAQDGVGVPLRELGKFERLEEDHTIFHKDLRPVEYVVADVGGRLAAPVYGMLQVEKLLAGVENGKPYVSPDLVDMSGASYWMGAPKDDNKSAFEWSGEWTVTYETFRDMGIAFGAALALIYILVVWEFGNFRVPALIMAPIPLTLLGIIPAHGLFFSMGWGGEFTATSMIGWIALAGIIVRNSILLVDFSLHEIRKGTPVVEAVLRSTQTRTRPILITAFALVCGSSVIFFDPIFQGMAISLASGVLVSTVLTLIVIPLGCVNAAESLCEIAGAHGCNNEGEKGNHLKGVNIEPAKPMLLQLWGGIVSVIGWVFLIIRGISLLVIQLFKDLFKKKPEAPDPAPATESVSSEPIREAKPTAPEHRAEPETDGADVDALLVTPDSDQTDELIPESETKIMPEPEPEPEPKVLSKIDARKKLKAKVVGRENKAATKKPIRKKSAVSKKKVSKKKVVGKKTTAAKKVLVKKRTPVAPTTVKKDKVVKQPEATEIKARHRGIRLKSMDEADDDGLA